MGFLRRLIVSDERPMPASASSPDGRELPPPSRLNVGWVTDVGEVRDHNEDSALVMMAVHEGDADSPSFALFILADGMGGHRAGELASSLAARVAAHRITLQSYLPSLLKRERDANQPALTEVLVDAVQAANSAVAKQVPGSGTTLTCALVLGTRAYIGHVGDSRAYVLANGRLEQITHDHSLVDRLVDAGQLTPDEAAVHPQKNVLYRAIGQSDGLEVDTHVRSIHAGEYLLLCSDGLWGLVGDDDMVTLIEGASSPQSACEELVAAANRAGGSDNVTVILWRSPLG